MFRARYLDGKLTHSSGKPCQILGFAMRDKSSFENNIMPESMIPREANLTWLLKQYPQGYSLDCDEEQAVPLPDKDALIADTVEHQSGTYEIISDFDHSSCTLRK